ncbi:MAG: hypothetical protein R3B48_15295 [Kofleriaceae bacterium]
MADFLRSGGFSMWIVLAFTATLLLASGRYALRPEARTLALVRALTWALLFSSIAGVFTNFMMVMVRASGATPADETPIHTLVLGGLGEAVTPAVLGFSALSLAWLFVVVGTRRRDDLELAE